MGVWMVIWKKLLLLLLSCSTVMFAGSNAYSCLSEHLIWKDFAKFDITKTGVIYLENAKQDYLNVEIHKFGASPQYGNEIEYEVSFVKKNDEKYSRKRYSHLSIKDEPTLPYLVESIVKTQKNGLLQEEYIYKSEYQIYPSKESFLYDDSTLFFSIKCRIENDFCVEVTRVLLSGSDDNNENKLTKVRTFSKELWFEGLDIVLDTVFHVDLSNYQYDLNRKYDMIQCGKMEFKIHDLNEFCSTIFLKGRRVGLFCEASNEKFLKLPNTVYFYSVKMSQYGLDNMKVYVLKDGSLYQKTRKISYDNKGNVKSLIISEGYPKENFFNRYNKIAPFSVDSLNIEYDDSNRLVEIIHTHKGKNIGSLLYNNVFRYKYIYDEIKYY